MVVINEYSSRASLRNGENAKNRRRLFERWVRSLAPLLALLALRTGEMTGYDLIKFVYKNFGVLLSAGTMYPMVHSLERYGMVTNRAQGTKRVYVISEEGECALRDLRLPFVRGQSVLMRFLNYEYESASDGNLPENTLPDVTATETVDRMFSPHLNDAGQTMLTQFAVPDLRDVAVEAEQILDYPKNLGHHDHALLLYDNLEQKWGVISKHFQYALENGQSAAYICHFEAPDQVNEALKAQGIDVLAHESHGEFRILEYGDYLRHEEFNQIEKELETLDKQLSKKNKTIRIAMDSTFAIKSLHAEKVVKYERGIGRKFTLPIAGICAYNTKAVTEISEELLQELLKLHGHAIFPGIALELWSTASVASDKLAGLVGT